MAALSRREEGRGKAAGELGDSIVHRGTGTGSVPTAGKRGNPTNLPCIQVSPRCQTQPRDAHAKAPGAHRPQHTPLVSKHSPDPVFYRQPGRMEGQKGFSKDGMWGSPSREIPGRSQEELWLAGREEQGEVIALARKNL